MFPFLGLILILVFIIAYYRRKGTNLQKAAEDQFWDREHEANLVRRKDLSGLPYISIPLENFPIGISSDEEILAFEKQLQALTEKKIVNFKNQSNTDLKLKYGPANLTALSEYDENFAKLASLLVSYASRLMLLGYENEAIPVLEFGVDCGSDVSTNYTKLAGIYQRSGDTEHLKELVEKASQLDSIMKQPILDKLNQMMEA